MSLAQALYEAGHITYMRTDGVSIAPAALAELRASIAQEFGAGCLPDTPREYKARSKNAQASWGRGRRGAWLWWLVLHPMRAFTRHPRVTLLPAARVFFCATPSPASTRSETQTCFMPTRSGIQSPCRRHTRQSAPPTQA